MTEFIAVSDLPAALQSAELVATMVAGANAKASRVAPCLSAPSTAWAATTAYAVDDKVALSGGEALQVTVAGTSGATEPTPPNLAATVTDGTVTWKRTAPAPEQLAEAKLILIGAVKRWVEAGAGSLQSQTAGPFAQTIDTRQRTGFNLWPSEIQGLQDICSTGPTGREAFSIDTVATTVYHLPWCSYSLGALYCSCGADIAGEPIYELG